MGKGETFLGSYLDIKEIVSPSEGERKILTED